MNNIYPLYNRYDAIDKIEMHLRNLSSDDLLLLHLHPLKQSFTQFASRKVILANNVSPKIEIQLHIFLPQYSTLSREHIKEK